MPDDYPVAVYYALFSVAFAKFGADVHVVERTASMMRDAGFINVQEHVIKLPIGAWAKDKTLRLVGMYWRMAINDILPAVGGKLLQSLGMTPQEIEVMLVGVRKALADTQYHTYMNFYFVCGQKPE